METRRRVAGHNEWFVLIGLVAFSGTGHAAENGLVNPKVTFTVSGPAGMTVVGTGTELTMQAQGQSLIFRVPLRSLTTGLAVRDRQMRDKYLEVESFPTVELRIARDAFSMPALNGNADGDAKAKLTLHGKTKDATVHYAIQRQGESVKVSGKLHIDVRAYGIDVPNHRGLILSPEVDIEIGFGALDRAVVADAPE